MCTFGNPSAAAPFGTHSCYFVHLFASVFVTRLFLAFPPRSVQCTQSLYVQLTKHSTGQIQRCAHTLSQAHFIVIKTLILKNHTFFNAQFLFLYISFPPVLSILFDEQLTV